jgi:hypothetical protein
MRALANTTPSSGIRFNESTLRIMYICNSTVHSSTLTDADTVSAPSAFVNTSFHHNPPSTIFVAGHPHATNYIHAHLRPRGPSAAPKLRKLVETIMVIWNEHVKNGGEGRLDDSKALHNVFIFEDLAAGAEQGFLLPLAGEEGDCVEENMQAFEKRAGEGDEAIKRLVWEVKKGFRKRS